MNWTALPFDEDAICAGLKSWIEIESPTWDAMAVNRMMAHAAAECAKAGAAVTTIPGTSGFGNCVKAHFPHANQGKPGILVMAHLDTVHPVGTLEVLPFRRDGEKCFGPGILDMKGGACIALEAVRQLASAQISTPLPVTFLFTSDEEVGSPSTRALIEAEAAKHHYVLVPEPARPDGGVVTGRYAIARFNLETIGRPSHAGATLADGRSAIREMARRIIAIEDMTSSDCTFSVGVVHGGQWVNCVATTCRGEVLSMAKRQADLDHGVGRMLGLNGEDNGVTFKVTRGVTRPVWEPDAQTRALFDHARMLARGIGFDITAQSAGGGSDGNFTGAMGIPTLDGLGLRGKDLHTLNEHILVASLPERARLMAGLMATLPPRA
ncbi:MAG: M20/M25/M40 family metallo-hydrolase [Beijerinckiaceae bacterium]